MSESAFPQYPWPNYPPFLDAVFLGREGLDDVWVAKDGAVCFWSWHDRCTVAPRDVPQTVRTKKWCKIAEDAGLRPRIADQTSDAPVITQ